MGVKVVATVWEILKDEGIAPERASATWAAFLCFPAPALLACYFVETITLTGQRQYVLAAIEHATRRVRVLGTTAHPTADLVTHLSLNLVMYLEDTSATLGYPIRTGTPSSPTCLTGSSPTPTSGLS